MKKKAPKIKYKKITLSSPEELFSMMDRFELRFGKQPYAIITTEEKRKTVMGWFGSTPEEVEEALVIKIRDILVLTPRDFMLL